VKRPVPPTFKECLEGQVIILFAVGSLLLVGMLALAVDVGYLLAERRQVQAAADAGALAAAHSDMMYMTVGEMRAAGKEYGAENAGVSPDDVEVNYPPTSGRFAGRADYVEVVIKKDVPRFFLGAVYSGDWSVTATAVAAIEPDGVDVALLALNPDSGGIKTGGSTYIETIGGSVVSNYTINGSGNTQIISDQHINANDGILRSGTVITNAGKGVNPNAPEVPDPLMDKISPPTLPNSPGNIVPNANIATPGECGTFPGYYNASGQYVTTGTPGLYGAGCNVTVTGDSSHGDFTFPNGKYKFTNGSGVSLGYQNRMVYIEKGTWNFVGGPGINLNGHPTTLDMRGGEYSFTGGAGINISGNSVGNHIGGNFYFQGGGGIKAGGSNGVTLYPGVYVFDGGLGIDFSGNARLHFAAGNYEFWFLNGADFSFSGSATITADPGAHAKMYFYSSGSNKADWTMSGWTDASQSIPSGEYYFDGGRIEASGSTKIRGDNVFMYFTNGAYLKSSGMAGFAFTAPTQQIYPGYYPGVFLYSDANNTAAFEWTGYTNGVSKGIIYLPSSKVVMSGYSNGKVFEGQFIADSFELSGNNKTVIQYHEYVQTAVPKVYLVD